MPWAASKAVTRPDATATFILPIGGFERFQAVTAPVGAFQEYPIFNGGGETNSSTAGPDGNLYVSDGGGTYAPNGYIHKVELP